MKKTILSLTLLLALGLMVNQVNAQVSIGISVHIAPPAIPVYEQPLCPADGYLWIPGYWAYGDDGYYWVPGYWEEPPTIGYLWTPGYWGYAGGVYGWRAGYWGPHIGFYGGVNYGCGYGGHGYYGGEWHEGHFRYNTAVTRVNTTIVHNTYVNNTVINNVTVNNRVSYNGGPGGVSARPTSQEQSAMNEHHIEHTAAQVQHQQAASQDRNQFAAVNHGRPANLAVARPMTTSGRPGAATASHPNNTPTMNHPNNTPNMNRPSPATVSRPNPNMDHTANAPQMHRPQPAVHTQPVNRPQPPMHAQQPQMHAQQPQMQVQRPMPMNHPQPNVAHAAPHPAPPHEGGGPERHHR